MQRKSNAVVFIGMVYPGGIVRHLALLGAAIGKCSMEADYYFASTAGDRERGAWKAVRAQLQSAFIIETASFAELVDKCSKLFLIYAKVVVHCGGGWGQTKYFIPLRNKYGKRLILVGTTHSYRHDSWLRIPMSLFQSFLYLHYYNMIVFQCRYASDRFWGARLLWWRQKAVIIPLGCELLEGELDGPPHDIASNTILCSVLSDKGLFKFVYLAAFRPGKMHAWLVRAMTPVLRQFPNARVLFCGGGDERVRHLVLDEINKAGVARQFVLPGHISRDEVPWLLAHCDCAVVPSRAETFGHNFLEPMFAGLPVLGTRVGVGCDIIRENETGITFSLSNPRSLQNGAEWILSRPESAVRMGSNAKKMVEFKYTHVSVAKQLIRLYAELLCDKSSRLCPEDGA